LPQDYWEYWPYKLIAPFRKSSMVDNSKFVDMVNTKLADRPFMRKFSWQSVDIQTGQVVIFDESTPMEVRNRAVMSSASIPFVFPPVVLDGMYLTDGGTF
jgi:predicted acylesterase/phospholipase RssA